MARTKHFVRGAALVGIATLALAACSSGEETTDGSSDAPASGEALKIGTFLPITGSLAFLGPPEIAGVDLAISEINEAGGVFGADVEVFHTDSSDTDNPGIGSESATTLINEGVGAVIGAASSSVTLNVVDDITNAGIVMFSPANTAAALSGYSPLYFRTAPPDTVQGDVFATLVAEDGHDSLGLLVFNDDYGTGLRDTVVSVFEGNGGTITYGAEEVFDPTTEDFSTIVATLLATEPSAIGIITFDQVYQIIPALIAAGVDPSTIYLVDGNTTDFTGEFGDADLSGMKGTIPGANPDEDFAALLDGASEDGALDVYAYGPESYDNTILVALAALKGGAGDGQTIADNLAAVSGANGGTECTGWVECADLIEAGEEINYQAVSGAGPFNEANDPSSAYIGIYEYDAAGANSWIEAIYGEVPAA